MQRHISNAFWNTLGFLIPTVALVLSTPIFTTQLGVQGFGLFALITTLLGLNGFAGLGLADATTKFVAARAKRSDQNELFTITQSSSAFYCILTVIFGVLLCLAAPVLIKCVFAIDRPLQSVAIASLQLGSIAFSLRIFESFTTSVLLGLSRYDIVNKIDVVSNLLLLGLQTLSLFSGHGILALIFWLVVVSAATAAIKCISVATVTGTLKSLTPRLHSATTFQLLRYSSFTWLQALSQLGGAQADRLLVAGLIGTEWLGYYVICSRVASLVQIIPARAAAFIFPLASEQHASGQIDRMRNTYFIGHNVTIACSIAIATPLFLFAPSILTLWVGPDIAGQCTYLLRIMIGTFALLSSSILPFYYLNGADMPGLNAVFSWAGLLLNVIGLILLLPLYQAVGAAFAKLLSHSLSLVCYPILNSRVFRDYRWYVGLLVLLPPVCAFSALAFIVPYMPQPTTLPVLLLCMAVSGLIVVPVILPMVFFMNPIPDVSRLFAWRSFLMYCRGQR